MAIGGREECVGALGEGREGIVRLAKGALVDVDGRISDNGAVFRGCDAKPMGMFLRSTVLVNATKEMPSIRLDGQVGK